MVAVFWGDFFLCFVFLCDILIRSFVLLASKYVKKNWLSYLLTEHTWFRLFQNRVVYTKSDIYCFFYYGIAEILLKVVLVTTWLNHRQSLLVIISVIKFTEFLGSILFFMIVLNVVKDFKWNLTDFGIVYIIIQGRIQGGSSAGSACPNPDPGFSMTNVWIFICSMIWGETWSFVLLILVDILSIPVLNFLLIKGDNPI